MNTSTSKGGLTVADLKVNTGVVRPAEVPLHVGPCGWKYQGEPITIAISSDKGWFWVRFNRDPLPPHLDAEMRVRGFYYSGKKRHGYWVASTPEIAKFLRQLGYHNAKHIVYDKPTIETLTREENETDMGNANQPKGTLHLGLRKNKAGRVIDASGHFVSNEKLIEMVTQANGTASKSGKVFTPPAPEVSEPKLKTITVNGKTYTVYEDGESLGHDVSEEEEDVQNTQDYKLGYDDGVVDGNDEDVPPVYDRLALARYLGVTMAQLVTNLGTDYILGYLEGFETVRPRQVAGGAKARMAQRMAR